MAEKSFESTNHPVWFNIYLRIQEKLKAEGLKRIGKCNHCGDCCKTIDIEVDFGRETYKVVDVENVNCKTWDTKEHRCSRYIFRPLLCRMFPMQPEDLKYLPNCLYKFVRIKKK